MATKKVPEWTKDWREVQRRADASGRLCEDVINEALESSHCAKCQEPIYDLTLCTGCDKEYCVKCFEGELCRCCGESFCSLRCLEAHR